MAYRLGWLTTAPSWAASQTAQTWAVVPMGAKLSDIDPTANGAIYIGGYAAANDWSLNSGQAALVTPWCGAAYDQGRDVMWLGMGGGHADYRGNEIYRCNFNAASPAWQIVRNPSGSAGATVDFTDGQEATGLYSDGRPRAIHTGNKWAYLPGRGPALVAMGGGSVTPTNGGKRWSALISESTGEASLTSDPTNFSVLHCDGASAAYDPSRGAIWITPGNTEKTARYDLSAGIGNSGSYTDVGSAQARQGATSSCYLPDDDCLLIGDSTEDESTGTWSVLDCVTGTLTTPTFSGSMSIAANTHGKCQPIWVPSLGAVCTWNNDSNRTLITKMVKPSNPRSGTWTVSALPVVASNAVTPTARTAHGTYGRFAYAPRIGGFLLFNSVSGSTYFYKL